MGKHLFQFRTSIIMHFRNPNKINDNSTLNNLTHAPTNRLRMQWYMLEIRSFGNKFNFVRTEYRYTI